MPKFFGVADGFVFDIESVSGGCPGEGDTPPQLFSGGYAGVFGTGAGGVVARPGRHGGGVVMKQPEDKFTLDVFEKRPRGRPRKPHAKSGAQRQREYRARLKNGELSSHRNGNS